MGKPMEKGMPWHNDIWLDIDCLSVSVRRRFLSARGNIWNSNVVFSNKTTCLRRRGCFKRYLSVVTPVQYHNSTDYASNEKKQIAKFHFPLKNVELNKQWIRFVNRRDWLARKHSVLCKLHFEEKYLRRGE